MALEWESILHFHAYYGEYSMKGFHCARYLQYGTYKEYCADYEGLLSNLSFQCL
jgi:hypothetical protein